ncbi:TPA: hypothetical protein ACM4HK_004540, partial [Escherichia coli]
HYGRDLFLAVLYHFWRHRRAWVVEFEDGKEPPVSANLDVAGGRLVSVLFGDYRDDFFQPEEVDVVREALNELSVDNDDAHAEIIKKMELLTH